MRRLWVSMAMLVIGASSDVGYVDPAVAYFKDTFGILGYATCARLYNYPESASATGSRAVPRGRSRPPVVSKYH
jgi:hypothetical protein